MTVADQTKEGNPVLEALFTSTARVEVLRLFLLDPHRAYYQRQIEAARVALTRLMKREGKVWIRIFPVKPVTKKPAETRMGSGKGVPEFWVAVVKPGRILFEMEGVAESVAREAMRLAAHKLPVKTKFVERRP